MSFIGHGDGNRERHLCVPLEPSVLRNNIELSSRESGKEIVCLRGFFSAHSLTSSFGRLVTSSRGDMYSVCTAEVSKQENCGSETERFYWLILAAYVLLHFVVGLHLLVALGSG